MRGAVATGFKHTVLKNWKDISLFKFQEAERINAKDIEALDKLLFTTCIVFDYTEFELDNMPPAKVLRLTKKDERVFGSEMKMQVRKRFGKYIVEYDPAKLTLGQYVELCFFFSMPVPLAGCNGTDIERTCIRCFLFEKQHKFSDHNHIILTTYKQPHH